MACPKHLFHQRPRYAAFFEKGKPRGHEARPRNANSLRRVVRYFRASLRALNRNQKWRGYALRPLEKRHGSLKASLILGVLWGLWHIPMFIALGMSLVSGLLMALSMVPGSLFFTWFYRRTGGSTLLAVLLHVGLHVNTPTHVTPETITSLAIYMLGYFGAATLLFLFYRRAFIDPVKA